MSEAIEKLTFKTHPVRVIRQGDSLLWCGVDCCKVLEVENARHALSRLDADEKLTVAISDGQRPTRANFVTEPGLYKLVMQSRKPVAKEFQRWVTHDVLPSIRKNGCYFAGCAPEFQGMAAEFLNGALARAREINQDAREKVWAVVAALGVEGCHALPTRMTADDFRAIVEWVLARWASPQREPLADEQPPAWAIREVGRAHWSR